MPTPERRSRARFPQSLPDRSAPGAHSGEARLDGHSRPRVAGFTLLEAVVALAIFAAVGMAVYGLFSANLAQLVRAEQATAQLPALHRAIEHLSSIDPGRESSGEFEFDGLRFAWSAQLLEPRRASQRPSGYRGVYAVGLYDVALAVSADGRAIGNYRLRLTSFERGRAGAAGRRARR